MRKAWIPAIAIGFLITGIGNRIPAQTGVSPRGDFQRSAGTPGFPKTDQRGSYTENFASQGARLHIHADKTRFRKDEAIPVDLTIANDGMYPLTIYLHRNVNRNFTLVARDSSGHSLPLKKEAFADLPRDEDPFYRTYTATNFHSRAVVIQPGESFHRKLQLRDLIDLPAAGDISLTGYFYPNPEQSPTVFLPGDNQLHLYLDPGYRPAESARNRSPVGLPLAVSPREIVYLALSAEYIRDWPAYFKYVDLKEFIRDYPEFARRYLNAPESDRMAALVEFQEYLKNRKSHKLVRFAVLPDESGQAGDIAEVQVKATRKIDGFDREFSYIYYLTRMESLWLITGVQSRLNK